MESAYPASHLDLFTLTGVIANQTQTAYLFPNYSTPAPVKKHTGALDKVKYANRTEQLDFSEVVERPTSLTETAQFDNYCIWISWKTLAPVDNFQNY